MKIIIFRPSVDQADEALAQSLLQAFQTKTLIDKTVIDDLVVYIFKD